MSQQDPKPTWADVVAKIQAKAAQDAGFRAAFTANPKEAIEAAFGVTFPAGLKFQAVEAPADTVVVVLPAAARVPADGALSDDDLDAVAGGTSYELPGEEALRAWFSAHGDNGTYNPLGGGVLQS